MQSANLASHEDRLILMKDIFVHSDDRSKYLNKEQRLAFLMNIKDGKIYDNHNCCLVDCRLMYVLDKNNNLFASQQTENFNHSFFVAGKSVKAAGFIQVDNDGYVYNISNESGHYTPTAAQMYSALVYFFDKFQNENTSITFENHENVQSGFLALIDLSYFLDEISSPSEINKLPELNWDQRPIDKVGLKSQNASLSASETIGYEANGADLKIVHGINFFSRFGLGPKRQKIEHVNSNPEQIERQSHNNI